MQRIFTNIERYGEKGRFTSGDSNDSKCVEYWVVHFKADLLKLQKAHEAASKTPESFAESLPPHALVNTKLVTKCLMMKGTYQDWKAFAHHLEEIDKMVPSALVSDYGHAIIHLAAFPVDKEGTVDLGPILSVGRIDSITFFWGGAPPHTLHRPPSRVGVFLTQRIQQEPQM